MRIAFVTPRTGPGVLGGAEAVMAEAAAGFAARGHEVEVLATCALDHYSWANELPAGAQQENGLLVRRFPVVRHPSRAALKAQLSVQNGVLPDYDHQVSWLGFQFSVPGMFEYLVRHGESYDAIVFAPYLFWSTSVCLPMVAERAVLIPCLHDELYARLEVLRPVFESPAMIWFLSAPEHELAHRLGPVAPGHSVTGAGVPVPPLDGYQPQRFRDKFKVDKPFLLYAGRREEGKGTAWMLEAFAQLVSEGGPDVDLVVLGKGDLTGPLANFPPEVKDRVIDAGYVPDELRNDAFSAALAYVQPSTMESFSRTIMEAWLAGTPVLANSHSEVVAWHCLRSGGGLTFSGGRDLSAQVRRLIAEPSLAPDMAAAGRAYVLEHYTWPVVIDLMEASLVAAR